MKNESLLKLYQESKDSYYSGTNESTLTDAEFDALKQTLVVQNLIDDNDVGTEILDIQFKKSKHPDSCFMGSLNKINTNTELTTWVNTHLTTSQDSIILQPKYDGISILLIYKNGKLFSGCTRGNGIIGEDITRNIKKMKGVPHTIFETNDVFIRGEIILTKTDFNRIENTEFKNLRNAAAGIAKRLDGTLSEYLTIVVYDILGVDGIELSKEVPSFFAKNNFNYAPTIAEIKNTVLNDVNVLIESLIAFRKNADFEMDGIVLKENITELLDLQNAKPTTRIAFKFEAESGITELLDVEWNVSNNNVTPVAILKPVQLNGITIQRASLHNLDMIRSLGLKLGDQILVSRRNDVIPYVEKVVLTSSIGKEITFPTVCPICSSELTNDLDNPFLVCSNFLCKQKRINRVLKWFKLHNCKGISDNTIETLFDAEYISDLPDIFELKQHAPYLELIPGFGKKTVKLLLESVEKSKQTSLKNILVSMNMKDISDKTVSLLLDYFIEQLGVTQNLFDTVFKQVCVQGSNDFFETAQIKGLGDITKIKIKKELTSYKELIETVINQVDFDQITKIDIKKDKIISRGKVCITGSLSTFCSRKQLEQLLSKNGFQPVSGVSQDTTYLVCNDTTSSSSKMKKAKLCNTTIVSEIEMLKIIQINSN